MIYSHLASTLKRNESQKNKRKLLRFFYEVKKSHLQLIIYVKQWKLKKNEHAKNFFIRKYVKITLKMSYQKRTSKTLKVDVSKLYVLGSFFSLE